MQKKLMIQNTIYQYSPLQLPMLPTRKYHLLLKKPENPWNGCRSSREYLLFQLLYSTWPYIIRHIDRDNGGWARYWERGWIFNFCNHVHDVIRTSQWIMAILVYHIEAPATLILHNPPENEQSFLTKFGTIIGVRALRSCAQTSTLSGWKNLCRWIVEPTFKITQK